MFYLLIEEIVNGDEVDHCLTVMVINGIYVCDGGAIIIQAVAETEEEINRIFDQVKECIESNEPFPEPQTPDTILVAWINGPIDQKGTFAINATEGGLYHETQKDEEILVLYIGRDPEQAERLLSEENIHTVYAMAQAHAVEERLQESGATWVSPGEA